MPARRSRRSTPSSAASSHYRRTTGRQFEVIWEGHQAVAAQFLDWLDGGPPPATTLVDNLQSTAMLFAAIRASETGTSVDVQEMAWELAGA